MRNPKPLLLLALLALSTSATSAPLTESQVPDPLKPWIPWVLNNTDPRACPITEDGSRHCRWPGTLQLQLDASGGSFALDAQLYAPGWLELPGDADAWPQNLGRSGSTGTAAVIDRNGIPQIFLPAGRHHLEGRWDWSRVPESLRVPDDTGLLTLKLAGRDIAHPLHSGDRLWLGSGAVAATTAQGNHLSLKVFRKVDDDLPPLLTTHIQLEVAGDVREEVIGPVLPPGWTPLSIDGGDLPVHVDDDRRIRVQARPGLWQIELVARAAAPLQALGAPSLPEPWPSEEVWSFQAYPDLRRVDVGGAAAIDPRQTQMPDDWRELPAYLLGGEGSALTLTETQRGQDQSEPDELTLDRQLWLDFDGGGYTLQDRLDGRLQSRWRLEAAAPIALGQALVDGAPQLITRHGEGIGVEVRRGTLALLADSRIEGGERRLPAHGWNLDIQHLSVNLHLPPAWRLFAAPGADDVPDTWLSQWTLLDL
jgi:hypothetical protein